MEDQLIQRLQYTLGPAGHRNELIESSGRRVDYTYDGLYRLVTETVTDPLLGDRTTTYTYDAVGNRQSRLVECDPSPCTGEDLGEGLTTYTYDANDRLLEESGPAGMTQYSYDANGNQVEKIGPDGTTVLTYDAENRLTSATTPESTLAYTYDHNGIRQSQTVDGETTRFLVDPNRNYAQVIAELDSTGQIQSHYLHGEDLLAQANAQGTYTYLADGLGSVRMLADESGQITDQYVYEAFGNLEWSLGDTANIFQFAGEQYDNNLHLYYLRARFYDQNAGRFFAQDPYLGNIQSPFSLHRYIYGNADPVNNTDPSGEVTLIGVMRTVTLLGAFPVSFGSVDYALRRPHYYDFTDAVCRTDQFTGCTKEQVWVGLTYYPAPGRSSNGIEPIERGRDRSVLFGRWPVRHRRIDRGLTVWNITEEGHILHRGSVKRKVISTESGVSIRTIGEGEGRFAVTNIISGRQIWRHSAHQISAWVGQ